MRWIAARAKYFLGRRHIIRISRLKNVFDELLRVAIVKREPGALHLHHNAMTFQKGVVVRVKVDGVFDHLVSGNRFGFRK